MVLRPLACWDYGFEFLCWHGLLSLGTVVFCQVEFSTLGRSLYQRSSTDCGVSECDREDSILRRLWPTGGFYATKEENTLLITLRLYLNDCLWWLKNKCFLWKGWKRSEWQHRRLYRPNWVNTTGLAHFLGSGISQYGFMNHPIWWQACSYTRRRRGARAAGQDLRSKSSCQKNPVPVPLTDSRMWSGVRGYRHDGTDVSDADARKPTAHS
jgi:hypothetical protein